METLTWAPHYVARCPVVMYEASQGSNSWYPTALVGELHMRPLETGFIHFQLCDLLDGRTLFEYTMCDPSVLHFMNQKFFVLRHENGSHKGFGFSNRVAAREMKARIERAQTQLAEKTNHTNNEKLISTSDQGKNIMQPVRWKKRKIRLKGFYKLTHIFDKSGIEIGYPTDVKHVAHIGWDGHSMDIPPNSSLKRFANPERENRLDASATGHWTPSSVCQGPPQPPPRFKEPLKSRGWFKSK